MKQIALLALGALFVAGCGAVDESGSEGSGEQIASDPEALNNWTLWVSEEPSLQFGTCGGDPAGATGAGCSGRYCDNMRLWCGSLPAGFTRISGDVWWSYPYVSEEQPAGVSCPVGHVMDGLRATGSYSDNVSIRCSPTSFPPQGVNCKWMPFFSEENGGTQWFDYESASYAVGVAVAVKCASSFCDSMSYYICEPRCTSDADCFSSCNVTTGRCVIG